jgi:hypothetical protein
MTSQLEKAKSDFMNPAMPQPCKECFRRNLGECQQSVYWWYDQFLKTDCLYKGKSSGCKGPSDDTVKNVM